MKWYNFIGLIIIILDIIGGYLGGYLGAYGYDGFVLFPDMPLYMGVIIFLVILGIGLFLLLINLDFEEDELDDFI